MGSLALDEKSQTTMKFLYIILSTVTILTYLAFTVDAECRDIKGSAKCAKTKARGKCNKTFAKQKCAKTCGHCTEEPTTSAPEPEDPADEYVPGEAGKAWDETEIDVVHQKISAFLSRDKDQFEDMFGCCSYGKNNKRPISENALFRLAFHDCFQYKDGTGGCDGCINWHNMGNKAPSPFPSVDTYCQHQHPKANETDNNGLDRLVEYLEKIYTDRAWPPGAPSLEKSLKGSGKSRADLWQFAANVALERTIERSNYGCRYDYFQRQQVPLLEDEGKGFPYGVWKCKIKLEKPLKFKFGRKDCLVTNPDRPYEAGKEEKHSNPHANADEILHDVKTTMGMSATDFIAVNAIHGMVHPFNDGSIGTKYAWLGSGPNLSNMMYKLIANRPTYDMRGSIGIDMKSEQPHNLIPFSVGDEEGNPVSMWGMRVSCSDCWNTTQSWAGGPCTFRPTMPTAPDAPNREIVMRTCYKMEDGKRVADMDIRGCQRADPPVTFSKEGKQIGNPGPMGKSSDPTAGWSNMFLLNYEAGLYKKFDIDPVAMRGTGCDGINLQDPNAMWTDGWTGVNAVTTSRINQCPITDVVDENEKPIHQIVEEFADDHDVWASAFLDGWGRMQEAGYSASDLTEGKENSWLGYYHLLDMGANLEDNFERFIRRNKPVVFTSEAVDPYVCGHQARRCETKISEVYEAAGIPKEIVGEPCTNFEECNSKTHGPLPE